MKKTEYFVSTLLLTVARLFFIAISAVWSYFLYQKINLPFLLTAYAPFRLFLLFPAELFRFHGGTFGAFRVFASIRLYLRAAAALLLRVLLYALIISPLSAVLLTRVFGHEYLPFFLAGGLMLTFILWLLYQRTFAVPQLLSNGFTLVSAYRMSYKLTKGKTGECALFYLKRVPLLTLRLTVVGWLIAAPFYYSQKARFTEMLNCARIPVFDRSANELIA